MARAVITIFPAINIHLEPRFLNELVHLKIKLIDVVVLVIWLLVSYISAKSILGQYGVLEVKSFRRLFYDVFFGRDMGIASLKAAVVIVLTAVSVGYIGRMVYFIYEQWSDELSPLLQCLQLYPALLMALQTLYQGTYLLKCHLNPRLMQDTVIQQHFEKSKQQLMDLICLNFSFILHCFCIFIVIYICTTEPKRLLEVMTGEVVYRVFAIVMFYKMLKQVERVDQVNRNSEVSGQSQIQIVALALAIIALYQMKEAEMKNLKRSYKSIQLQGSPTNGCKLTPEEVVIVSEEAADLDNYKTEMVCVQPCPKYY